MIKAYMWLAKEDPKKKIGRGVRLCWSSVNGAGRERGAVAIMFAAGLLVIIGLFEMSLGLAQVYNRRIELQNVADAAALAAAHELDGTSAGVDRASTKAGNAAEKLKVGYTGRVTWSAAAIKFSTAANGPWVDGATARAAANRMFYVKVDTNGLGASYGAVQTLFIRISHAGSPAQTAARAIAGPSAINVVPFAICAMSTTRTEQRNNPAYAGPPAVPANTELVEFGFRRGVGYDLMQLNPDGTDPKNYVVSPVAGANSSGGVTAYMDDETVGSFICTGTMASRPITEETVAVATPFPLSSLFNHFNSRFDKYPTGACNPNAAPPDANVKWFNSTSYDPLVANGVPWMNPLPTTFQSADKSPETSKLRTIADLPYDSANPYGITPVRYGVLWSYARAVPYTTLAEPSGGYTPFSPSYWSSLYNPGRPAAPGYPTSLSTPTPYSANSLTTYFLAPDSTRRPGVRNRRVLNVPLLACPVSGSSATVVGIGKFFMTVPATPTQLYAEFAGLAAEESLRTHVELYP